MLVSIVVTVSTTQRMCAKVICKADGVYKQQIWKRPYSLNYVCIVGWVGRKVFVDSAVGWFLMCVMSLHVGVHRCCSVETSPHICAILPGTAECVSLLGLRPRQLLSGYQSRSNGPFSIFLLLDLFRLEVV